MIACLLPIEIFLLLLARLIPVWRTRHSGCDSFYFLLSAEVFKQQKRVPITLPDYYLADIGEQWYPPGFTVFIGLIPEAFVKKYHWLIASLLDLMNMLVMDAAMFMAGMSTLHVCLANFAYIIVPTLTLECRTMNSRPLGSLLFSLFMFSLLLAIHSFSWIWLPLVVWFLILMTHKMTMQIGCVLAPILSWVYGSWVPILVVYGGIPLTVLLSKGYYLKIFRGHWDIVSFWNRQWPWIYAHQVYDSPAYGRAGRYEYLKRNTWKRILFHVSRVFLHNPLFLAVVPLFLPGPWQTLTRFKSPLMWMNGSLTSVESSNSSLMALAFCWSMGTLIWAILTSGLPFFRAMGEGWKYAKYAAVPVAILVPTLPWPVVAVTGFVSVVLLCAGIRRSQRKIMSRNGRIDSEFEKLLDWLKKSPEVDRLGCISTHMADAIVYFCKKRVLWGGHHYHFNRELSAFFPVFQCTMAKLSQDYDLKYWVVDSNYVKPLDVGLFESQCVKQFGQYQIFSGQVEKNLQKGGGL